jgi:putative phosphoesterase
MTLVIASDIHGSAYYCRKLLDIVEEEKPDRLVLLGDILYHGPRNDLPRDYAPKEVIAMLNPLKDIIISVRGNCDTEVDQMVLNFDVLSDSAVIYDGETELFLTHGHKYSPENPPKLKKGAILLGGHTHVACDNDMGNFRYINPGSVSIPKGGTERGGLVYENGSFRRFSLEDAD